MVRQMPVADRYDRDAIVVVFDRFSSEIDRSEFTNEHNRMYGKYTSIELLV
jgi:hypothetical protein